VILLIAVSLSKLLAVPQKVQNLQERKQDKVELSKDVAAVADDRRDVDRLSHLIIRWDRARKAGNDAALKTIEQNIFTELRQDLKETKMQTAQAGAEVKRSDDELKKAQAELKKDKRNVKRARMTDRKIDDVKAVHEKRDDVRDMRDDRRDVKNDVRDAKQVQEILLKKRQIAKELVILQKQIDARPAAEEALQMKQRKLLEDYLELSQQEVKLGIIEFKEDQQELREDRRETKEDKR
jgi:hypothetical protein